MSKTKKITILSVFLVFALSLTACGQLGLTSSTSTSTPVAATAVPTESAAQTSSSSPLASTSLEGYQSTLENIYAQVNPSVVNIQVTEKTQVSSNNSSENPFSDIPGFQYFFGSPDNQDQQNSTQTTQALGSGFVWNKDGYIVTNNHVISSADTIQVKFYDGTIASAKVIGTDVNSDLAVLKLEDYSGELYPITTSDSTDVKVGQVAIAIGNPYGLENTMTVGIVSALGRSLPTDMTASSNGGTFTIPDIIQTDAPINPGNSGGVLVNDQGELIGVTSAIESSSGSNAGIGFAVPSSTVNKVIPALIDTGTYEHAYLGLTGTTLTPDIAKEMDVDTSQRGVLVVDVTNGGPADKAGLKGGTKQVSINGSNVAIGGDIVTAIDGQELTSIDDLISYLSNNTEVGQKVTLTILRNGAEKTLEATLIARPSSVEEVSSTQSQQQEMNSTAWMGISVTAMTSGIAKEMGLSENQKGVLIQDVETSSPADEAGLIGSYKPVLINSKRVMIGGDVITAIDGQSINSVDDLQQYISSKNPGDDIQVSILRDGKELSVSVSLIEKPNY
jgi:serine protease Do